MNTPIVDFVKKYINDETTRFHMPGHKGESFLGFEKYDITEVFGADDLSCPEGIIKMSEDNLSSLFKTLHSFYTTGGSTTAICAMLSLVKVGAEKPLILAARNIHKAFINACALLDFDVSWLIPQNFTHITECKIDADYLEEEIKKSKKRPNAVYLTSPDYLGNIQDIKGISKVCKKYDIPLLVDNAHGAYLAFLESSLHPIHQGATACSDSAHKTLPVLTGGAYLHISKGAPKSFIENARSRLSLFSSTSPSYLILQSLDLCNSYIENGYREKLSLCIKKINSIKKAISDKGFSVLKTEPLKIVIDAYSSGYTGYELGEILRHNNIEPEFCDEHFLVLMITPQNSDLDFKRLENTFGAIPVKPPKEKKSVKLSYPITRLSIKDAVFSKTEIVSIKNAKGRICAAPTVSCPPAVPIAISGEEITKESQELFKLYGINTIQVIKRA